MTDNETLIENHIKDIAKIFPGKLFLNKAELSQLRNVSQSTINREKAKGKGIPYKDENGKILYAVRDTAIWMTQVTKTTL